MAVQIKVNPTLPNIARSFNGKSVSVFTVDTKVAGLAASEMGANGAFPAIMSVITRRTTPVMISAIDAGVFDVYVEGEFPGLADVLQADIRELGANLAVRSAALVAVTGETESEGVDVSGATVVAGEFYQADQINVPA